MALASPKSDQLGKWIFFLFILQVSYSFFELNFISLSTRLQINNCKLAESDTPQDDAPQPNIWEWEILPEGEEEFVVFKQIIWSENHHKIYEGIIARAEKERLYPAKKQFKKYHYAARKKFEKLVPADIAKTYDEVAKEYKHTGIEYENMKPQITFAHKPTRSLLSIFHLLLYEASPSERYSISLRFNLFDRHLF